VAHVVVHREVLRGGARYDLVRLILMISRPI
jgi:hypothetical protein